MIGYLLTQGLGNFADPVDVKYLLSGGLSFSPKKLILNLLGVVSV